MSEVIRVEPVCDSLAFLFMEQRGITLPSAVAEALERKVPPGKPHWEWCIAPNSMTARDRFDEDLLRRYHQPLLDFLDSAPWTLGRLQLTGMGR